MQASISRLPAGLSAAVFGPWGLCYTRGIGGRDWVHALGWLVDWWKAAHFSRGVVMACAFLGAAPAVLEHYSPLDLVAVVHAVIVGWDQVAGAIAGLLHRLGLPEFPPEIATSFMLAAAIGPAWSFSIFKSEWGQHKGIVHNVAFGSRGIGALVETGLWCLFVVAAPVGTLLWWLALLPLLVSLGTALARLPAYRHGFLFALGVLAAMEGVYLLSTDAVQSAFDGFVCEHQTVDAPRCAPEDPA